MMDSNERGILAPPVIPASVVSQPPHRAKRRKVAIACERCRIRKVRCDGQRPSCGPCLEQAQYHQVDANCVYSKKPAGRRADHQHNQTIRLEGRPPSRQGSSRHVAWTSPRDSLRHTQFQSTPQGQYIDHPERVSAMMGEVAMNERSSVNGYFGSSSAAGFMQQIKMAVNREVPSKAMDTESLLFPHLTNPRPSVISAMRNHVLPQRRVADELMGIYWETIFPLYPFFNREQLRTDYLKIWDGEGASPDNEDMIMCALNVIFALGCQLSESIMPGDRPTVAETFFARARDLLQSSLWHSKSTTLIQCLLLMATYLQSTDCADQCWMITGMAIRSAQGLGLHLPQTSSLVDCPQDRDLVRRIWHGCVLMDRVLALTLGRPPMISSEAASAVPLPAIGYGNCESHSTEPRSAPNEDDPPLATFYAKSLELYEIMNQILLGIYRNELPLQSPEDLKQYYAKRLHEEQTTVLHLDHALTEWFQSLPWYLSDESERHPENRVISRQGVILKLRFLHIRMILLRPMLSRYCDLYTRMPWVCSDDSLPQRITLQCSIICVKSAQDLISIIHARLPPDNSTGLLPSWWYNILYIYTAATVLIAGLLHPAILSQITEVSLSNSWQHAIEVLQKYQHYSSSAQRCIVALELLHEKVCSTDASARSPCPTTSHIHNVSFGEGLSAAVSDGYDMPEVFDLSWLNSVPSNLAD